MLQTIKMNLFYKGKDHEAYLSHVKVQIPASRKNIYLVLVYGITEHPVMLATNKGIKSKEDVTRVARAYFFRWKIKEYFRCKKNRCSCLKTSVCGNFVQSMYLTFDIVNIPLHFFFTKSLSCLFQRLIILFSFKHWRQATIG